MPVENGALIEPISCVVRAARLGELTFASSVVIMGGGSIGLLHLQMAKNCGAAPIITIDDVPERLEWAKRLEADFVLSRDEASGKQVRTLTDGRGADFVIESDGKVENYDHIFQLVRPGGKIIAFGLPPENSAAQFRPFHVGLREISMTGSCAGMGDDLSDAITLVKHGRFQLKPFTAIKIPLERIEEGFNRSMDDTTSPKILISMD
jgi:threonine dehydrogenase-like Zn-dependent dehydrogenase